MLNDIQQLREDVRLGLPIRFCPDSQALSFKRLHPICTCRRRSGCLASLQTKRWRTPSECWSVGRAGAACWCRVRTMAAVNVIYHLQGWWCLFIIASCAGACWSRVRILALAFLCWTLPATLDCSWREGLCVRLPRATRQMRCSSPSLLICCVIPFLCSWRKGLSVRLPGAGRQAGHERCGAGVGREGTLLF